MAGSRRADVTIAHASSGRPSRSSRLPSNRASTVSERAWPAEILRTSWILGALLGASTADLARLELSLQSRTVVGLMMGVWFLSISVAQYFAGIVAQFASVETVGGQVTNLKVSLDTYTATFTTIAWIAIGAGVLLFLLSWPLQKWMHGVK